MRIVKVTLFSLFTIFLLSALNLIAFAQDPEIVPVAYLPIVVGGQPQEILSVRLELMQATRFRGTGSVGGMLEWSNQNWSNYAIWFKRDTAVEWCQIGDATNIPDRRSFSLMLFRSLYSYGYGACREGENNQRWDFAVANSAPGQETAMSNVVTVDFAELDNLGQVSDEDYPPSHAIELYPSEASGNVLIRWYNMEPIYHVMVNGTDEHTVRQVNDRSIILKGYTPGETISVQIQGWGRYYSYPIKEITVQ